MQRADYSYRSDYSAKFLRRRMFLAKIATDLTSVSSILDVAHDERRNDASRLVRSRGHHVMLSRHACILRDSAKSITVSISGF